MIKALSFSGMNSQEDAGIWKFQSTVKGLRSTREASNETSMLRFRSSNRFGKETSSMRLTSRCFDKDVFSKEYPKS